MPAPANNSKPYVKLAATLSSLGLGLYFLEQFGLREAQQMMHLEPDGLVVSILFLAPFVLILAAIVVFVVGKMRRL
ncbi:hypothetical protein [Devosia sp.]|uniref:hypothetical protein n=1 Tax=Devosia sp. TaxID=1871048 RepID=UPI001AD4FBB3|nr:hypothetical protein [Devosia sp.]MBN9308206.1 hypothetical protein [Devosia sp.]